MKFHIKDQMTKVKKFQENSLLFFNPEFNFQN